MNTLTVENVKDMILNGATKEQTKEALEIIYPGAMQKVKELIAIMPSLWVIGVL